MSEQMDSAEAEWMCRMCGAKFGRIDLAEAHVNQTHLGGEATLAQCTASVKRIDPHVMNPLLAALVRKS